MTPRIVARATPLDVVLLALLAAALVATGAAGVAPHGRLAPVELGDAFAASLGLVWALGRAWAERASRQLARSWLAAAGGAALILAAAALDSTPGFHDRAMIELAGSTILWIAAASLIFSCGRRYAMRRYVMPALQAGVWCALAALACDAGAGAPGAPQALLGAVRQAAELVSATLFVGALVMTQFAPMKRYVFGPSDIGRRARRMFRDFGVESSRKYPTVYPALGVPGVRHVFIVLMILWYAPTAARAAAQAGGRSPLLQVWDMLRLGFVEGVDAKSYYVHDLYRADRRSAADETLTRVETKNGLTRALQEFDANPSAAKNLNDKLAVWRALERGGVSSAPILAVLEHGVCEHFADMAAFDRNLFVKERAGRGGTFTLNFERIAPFVYRSDSGAALDLDEILETLKGHSASRRLIVQPKLANHPAIASFADQALIVFRVVTCLDAAGQPRVTHGIMRLLRRFEPNWPTTADADWGCAVDLATGRLGQMTGDAPSTCTLWFDRHPVTGERVEGRILEGWKDIAETARAAHRVFAGRALVGWDIGWTPEGACVLEGNSNMDFSYFQRVYRTPIGRSPLAPLLNAKLAMLADRLSRESARRSST